MSQKIPPTVCLNPDCKFLGQELHLGLQNMGQSTSHELLRHIYVMFTWTTVRMMELCWQDFHQYGKQSSASCFPLAPHPHRRCACCSWWQWWGYSQHAACSSTLGLILEREAVQKAGQKDIIIMKCNHSQMTGSKAINSSWQLRVSTDSNFSLWLLP